VSSQLAWSRVSVVTAYEQLTGLMPPERVWLAKHTERFRDARILDLGVGCGRTSPALLELSRHYVGVDYSPEMIACARRHSPHVDYRVGDARNLEFADASFDLVVFSFNGLDYVDTREDRLRALRELRRVLVPGGTLLFSSHNLDRPPAKAYDPRQIRLTLNPARLAWRTYEWVVGLGHYLRLKNREIHGGGWAILNNKGHNYRLLTYYVTPRVQRDELESSGFSLDELIGSDGTAIPIDHGSAVASFIYYSATAVLKGVSR
jgi:SAM-dependent methyltransferase